MKKAVTLRRRKTLTSSAILRFAVLLCVIFLIRSVAGAEVEPLAPNAPGRLPLQIDGRSVLPDVGCFWSFDLAGDDYKNMIDAIAPTNAFDVLSITLRSQKYFDGNQEAVAATKRAAEYAFEKYGIKTLLDLDLRIARYDFEKVRPDLLQERLLFSRKEISNNDSNIAFTFQTNVLSDHYTGSSPYYVRGGRVVKAWTYACDAKGVIDPKSIRDVTSAARWNDNRRSIESKLGYEVDDSVDDSLEVTFDKNALPQENANIAVAVAFRYSYPDLFADETLELEKRVFEQYKDVPTLGGYKDEWGFPPNFNRDERLDDFWFSERMAHAYARQYVGRDLVDDLFLAFQPQKGLEKERIRVVDQYRKLCSDRAVAFEKQCYRLNKEIWGDDAFVGVHCTWFPWPNVLEMRKNGIMWWKSPRDVAQTDEFVPFCIRNSLAKGCGSLWINMFYARQSDPYVEEHWTSAASGGRVHLHSIYPRDENSPSNPLESRLLPIVGDAGVNRIREKIRMLNLVSNSQIDSPVAVVFGRIGASNPLRSEYLAVGVDICDLISSKGYPTDLIPVDEVFSNRPDGTPKWQVRNSHLAYGDQQYSAILLYGESDAEKDAWLALHELADKTSNCRTKFIVVPVAATRKDKEALATEAIDVATLEGVVRQTPWVRDRYAFGNEEEISYRPPRTSVSRFLDGSVLWIASTESDFGDPIVLNKEKIELKRGSYSPEISVVANGVFLTRFDDQGELDAVVASEVKSLTVGELSFVLSDDEIGADPVDIAVWKDANGQWRGVFQRHDNVLPPALQKIVPKWNYLQRR